MNTDTKYWDLMHQIIGIFYDVYNELGLGFSKQCMKRLYVLGLPRAGFDFKQQVATSSMVSWATIGEYDADIVVNKQVLLGT